MWHCNATRQKQGKRERMRMCVHLFVFMIQQMFAPPYILREETKTEAAELVLYVYI